MATLNYFLNISQYAIAKYVNLGFNSEYTI
jgi:hypothetical protein